MGKKNVFELENDDELELKGGEVDEVEEIEEVDSEEVAEEKETVFSDKEKGEVDKNPFGKDKTVSPLKFLPIDVFW